MDVMEYRPLELTSSFQAFFEWGNGVSDSTSPTALIHAVCSTPFFARTKRGSIFVRSHVLYAYHHSL